MWFNEWDRYAAQWLRNLWPDVTVDDRDIADVQASDVVGHARCHFFAGIGGWQYALDLAGWPEDRPIWTASLPCQPFSAAGRSTGLLDQRHLWPAFHRLVAECRPSIIVGEQVASRAGRAWLAGICTDLEDLGYAVGAADLCAAGVAAPHIRQRLFWVADAGRAGDECRRGSAEAHGEAQQWQWSGAHARDRLADGGMGDAQRAEWRPHEQHDELSGGRIETPSRSRRAGGMGDTNGERRQGLGLSVRARRSPEDRVEAAGTSPWVDSEWLVCLDGKARRVGAGIRPLAHGVPRRASKIRAYGNSIVPQIAATFLRAVMGRDRP